MPNNAVQVIIKRDSALPRDDIVNNFSIFTANAQDAVAAAAVEDALQTMYQAWMAFVAPTISGEVVTKWYDRADVAPRVPWRTDGFGIINPSGNAPLPPECAIALSFNAAPVSGVAAARRRGRVFIGPWATNACSAAGADAEQPAAALLTIMSAAAGAFMDASQAAASWTWNVWSGVDLAGREVVAGWVDNAWDTQRRRGIRATQRNPWS